VHNDTQDNGLEASQENQVLGYGILNRLPGLWNGPVSTTTPAGSFDNWYVDFRPVLPGQISQYSSLDEQTINYLSFFIVKEGDELKIAMRTEGVFQNKGCVTYESIVSVREEEGYYQFADFKTKTDRAYTEFRFKDDSLIMDVYTNKFNKVSPLELHARWEATRTDSQATRSAIKSLNFPQPHVVKDFSDAFADMSESIFYTFERDPYPSATQPYVGEVHVTISVDDSLPIEDTHELFLLLTTESLFENGTYDPERLKYISRYAFLPVGTTDYTFTHVHPGRYHLYSYNDINQDKKHQSGDYICSKLDTIVTLPPEGRVDIDTHIDMIIP